MTFALIYIILGIVICYRIIVNILTVWKYDDYPTAIKTLSVIFAVATWPLYVLLVIYLFVVEFRKDTE